MYLVLRTNVRLFRVITKKNYDNKIRITAAGMGGVCREEHGDQRSPADARLSVLREEDADTVRQGNELWLHVSFYSLLSYKRSSQN